MKLRSILLGMLLAALVLGSGCGKQQEPGHFTLRYAHTSVQGETQARFVEEFARLVSEKTQGRIEIQIFPNSQLGNTSEMIDGVKTGVIDMAHHDFALLGKLLDDMSVFNVPYLYRDAVHSLKATDPATSPVMQELSDRLVQEAGIRVLGSFYRGERQLTTNFPVTSPDDLKGKKIRGIPLKVWMVMIEGMGAIPTPVEMSEVATALMTGVVVGQENPLSNILAHKLYEVQSHVIMTSHMHAATCVFVNDRLWQKIPESDRILMKAALDEISRQTLVWETDAAESNAEMLKQYGMTFIGEAEGLDLEAFQEAVGEHVRAEFPAWQEYIERIRQIQ